MSHRPLGLLTAPPAGGGEKGGLVEKSTHPKPTGGASMVPGQRHRALLASDRQLAMDGNWHDAGVKEEMGLPQGNEAKIGGAVDMGDDVYLEFDEEETKEQEPKLLARYMASFKPHTKAMFKRFIEEVWHLRSGIEYSEKGKNYYMITLFSKGDYDFVKRGGPWIFNQNALIVTDLDESLQPSETALNAVPVWVRIYDVPWGKQNEIWGYRYGDGLGKTLEVDVPATEQQKKEFFRVRVNLPYDRRLQTRIITGVKGKPQEAKVFKLKYERVPYYCSHCGFMGHESDEYMASPINFNQFLEKEKLKSNGSNFTDWFRHNMNKRELFAMLKSAEIEIKKEHQVLMVNKTTSFKKQGKSKGKNKKSGKKAATPPVKPKSGPKPDAECYYARRRDTGSVIAPSIWRI
ncbi:hypothetical protein QYE76_002214 [Lolium multiflorum]|uniref:DUF4283 domain-containing protein n=1 Tax=Lolium multiflorum TaxID=4521 RepID=A0AAD8RMR7_LOLMU|nr:hypothetical protein QYE76_002214 [Lolium multiflorum]